MQTYPADFDGVIAGAPGPNMPLQSVRMMWFSLQQKWQPQAALLEGDWALYEQRVTAACDPADGRTDGIVENPAACQFDAASLQCRAGQDEATCIPAARLAMLRTIIAPLRDANGAVMDRGLFPGVRTRPGPPSPLLRAMWADAAYQDPDWDEDSFDRTGDLALINRVMPELRADRTSIAPFLRLRGKAIIYQGWADPSTNAGPTIDYFASLARDNGGLDRLGQSVRLYMVPGMYHCGGGPGANQFGGSGHTTWPQDPQRDMLWALIDWVEKDAAPTHLTAAAFNGERESFTRRLCPFPQSLSFAGPGGEGQCRPDPTLLGLMDAGRPLDAEPAAR